MILLQKTSRDTAISRVSVEMGMNLLWSGRRLGWPVGITEGFDCFAQGLTGAIHGGASILKHLAEGFDGLDRCSAISHVAICVESIMAG
jgi:hypothetical protein